jgi:hypothetical protein
MDGSNLRWRGMPAICRASANDCEFCAVLQEEPDNQQADVSDFQKRVLSLERFILFACLVPLALDSLQ